MERDKPNLNFYSRTVAALGKALLLAVQITFSHVESIEKSFSDHRASINRLWQTRIKPEAASAWKEFGKYAGFLNELIAPAYEELHQRFAPGFKALPVHTVAKRARNRIRNCSQREKYFITEGAVVWLVISAMLAVPYFGSSSTANIKNKSQLSSLTSLISPITTRQPDYLLPSRGRARALAQTEKKQAVATATSALMPALHSPPEKTQAAAVVAPSPPAIAATTTSPEPKAPPAPGGDLKNSVGIDYAWSRPGGAAIAGRNYRFVARYLSKDASKNASPSELADLKATGLPVVLVWETTETRSLSGAAGGADDAQSALAQADALGAPANAPIYFAVDFPVTPDQLGPVDDYLRGAASVLGVGRIGVYGSYYAVNHCFDIGTATYGWQTFSWSDGKRDPRAHIFQDGRLDFGGDADLNVAQQSYIGQW